MFIRPYSRAYASVYTDGMEVIFTPEQIERLSHLAVHQGVETEQLVKEAALHLLEEDAAFQGAVRQAIGQADRGELIDEAEMDARVKRMFNP